LPIGKSEKRTLLRSILHIEYDDVSQYDGFITEHEKAIRELFKRIAEVLHNEDDYKQLHKAAAKDGGD
jgi:hypothetical protein